MVILYPSYDINKLTDPFNLLINVKLRMLRN